MAIALLREETISEGGLSMLDTMESSAQRGADIIRQLLTFARGSEGQKVPVSTSRLIMEMSKIIGETFPKSISLRTEVATGPWPIMGDPTQLHQVLLNLCVNARDAMPGGGTLTITAQNVLLDACYLRMIPEGKAGPHVVLHVADTGSGMAPATVDRIFEPFFTTKEMDKGTGLGLATVLGIVKGHGGFIQVESQLGRGTQFKIHLPAAPIAQPGSGTATAQAAHSQGKGELVLLVEDEPGICEVTRRALEKNGYRVLFAREGTEAISLFVQNQPAIQLLLTDMMMPVMDGEATIRVLRGMQPHLRIVAVSGVPLKPVFLEDSELRVQAWLQKPYTAETLLNTVRRVLDAGAH
jgi:CheY-like chemotaxis protein